MEQGTNKIHTYEQYVEEMKLQIAQLTQRLYDFKKNDINKGMAECVDLSEMIFALGAVSKNLRSVFNNHIPTQYDLIDSWLGSLDVDKLEILFLVSFLRSTVVAREGLNNWMPLRDKIAVKLEGAGFDSKKLLKGLY